MCRKLELQPGMRVLELGRGRGWGSFALYAAKHYGAEVTAVTVSKEQVKLGRQLCHGEYMVDADVIIVGGGPAGSSCAWEPIRHGF